MALEIIGAGFGRTGTNSLKIALERLGFGPCHHMFEIRDNPDLLPDWEAIGEGGAFEPDKVFKGYRSQVDWPGARFWRESAAHYPDAKVILTVRDPDRWFDSANATIIPAVKAAGKHDNELLNRISHMAINVVDEPTFDGRIHERDHAIAVYNKHIEEVKAAIPPERLLVFHVAQGWEPLCAFLGVEVPDEPFPHTNSTQEFSEDAWDGLA